MSAFALFHIPICHRPGVGSPGPEVGDGFFCFMMGTGGAYSGSMVNIVKQITRIVRGGIGGEVAGFHHDLDEVVSSAHEIPGQYLQRCNARRKNAGLKEGPVPWA
jgi:hypothetical protein